MLVFADLIKTYRLDATEVRALRGVSGSFRLGEMTALVGPSGSGKSSLLQIAGLIDEPDSGELSFGGVRLDRLDDKGRTRFRQRHFGFVFQAYHLLPTLTALENVALPGLLAGGVPFAVRERAAQLLAAVGLAGLEKRDVRALSGGQRQRVAIARALINGPQVIFADEPTANLDAASGTQVLQLLMGLCASQQVALVLATHDPVLAARADQVITLRDGLKIGEGRGLRESG